MKYIILLIVFCSTQPLFSQINHDDAKRDYTWLIGYKNAPQNYSPNILNFNSGKLTVGSAMKQDRTIGFLEFNTSICDEQGEVLFYSNGCTLRNRNHHIPTGCDSINYTPNSFCNVDGLRILQAGLILPQPMSKDTFLFFHKTDIDPVDYYDVRLSKLYAKDTTVRCIFKNKILSSDTVVMGEMTAVRHSNGTDWWVINPIKNSNQYLLLLVQRDTIIKMPLQRIGAMTHTIEDWWSQSSFSPDGKHFVRARGGYSGLIHFFDFDRRTGQLSNPQNTNINPLRYDGARTGVAFSPNSRFLYVSRDSFILQYDLQIPNFFEHADTVVHWEKPKDEKFLTYYRFMQLAPDCRIYISTGAATPYMHTILYPNRKGKACGVLQNKLKLPTYVAWGVPNYPHFRLGAAGTTVSPCDSSITFPLSVGNAAQVSDDRFFQTAVYPNPVSEGSLNVDFFGLPTFRHGKWTLYSITGQSVASFELLPTHSEYNLSLGDLPEGIYLYNVQIDGQVLNSGKLIVE